MQHISIIEPPTLEAIKIFAEKRNISNLLSEIYTHSQEDYLIASSSPPVFVVSDGVTLDVRRLAERRQKYPNPSPAGDVSRIFCESVIEISKNRYQNLIKDDIVDIFKKANNQVAAYNQRVGKSDISGNPTGFYSATGSFVVIKDNKGYWASICDSFLAHFDREMNCKFMSSGLCTPYAVINGEEQMIQHIETGILDLENRDIIFVFTDGFEHYVENQDFCEIFKNWDGTLKDRLALFSKKMNRIDPDLYGHERSLIAICVE